MEERALRSSSLVAFSTAASPSILFPSILPRSLQCLPWDGAARKKTEALAQGGKEESSLRVVSPASGGRGKERGREGLPVAAIAGGGGGAGAHLDIFSLPSLPLPPNSQKALLLVSFTRVHLGCSSALDTASSAPPDSGPRTHTQQPPPLKRGRSRGTAQKQRQRQRSSV